MIKTVRAGYKVKRFHTVDLIVGETVGHHSANVAMLCVILNGDAPIRSELMAAALTHDVLEQFTGDIPATAKWASAALSAALHDMEERYTTFSYDLTAEECKLMKTADMLDLCFKCLEELKMGNSTVHHIWRNGVNYLRRNYAQNEVLQTILQEMENDYESK
jgi:5'-deoxynucleotidase YfbR-like HD superfamily hydrolase